MTDTLTDGRIALAKSNIRLVWELSGQQWAESLEAVLGDNVAQRIKADGAIIALEGKNFRER